MNAPTQNPSASNVLASRAMLVSLSISSWSARKLDKSATQQIHQENQAQSDAGRYNKLLLPKDALKGVQKVIGATRGDFLERTLPWANDGQRIMAALGYLEHSQWFRKQKSAFDQEVNKFLTSYDNEVNETQSRLGSLFNPADYPPASVIAQKFDMNMLVWNVPAGDDFRVNIAEAQIESIRTEIEASVNEATNRAITDIYNRVSTVLERMVERLTKYQPASGPGEKPEGIFRDSLVENVRDLVGIMPTLNITGDPALDVIAKELKSLTQHDAETLRADAQARSDTANAAKSILESVNSFIA